MLRHPAIERRAGEAESGRGMGNIALVERQRLLNRFAFDPVKIEGLAPLGVSFRCKEWKIFGFKPFAAC